MSFDQLCSYTRDRMATLGIPGVAVGVWHAGAEYYAAFGVTNVDHPLPVTPDTLFQIGSITKTFVGTAIARLVEQGRVAYDAPVRAYLPEFRLADESAAAALTIRHLLTHTSGFQGDYFLDTGAGDDALARYVARMPELARLAPPGVLWSYCNSGFSLAGRVIEAVTGKTFEAALTELILTPLGLIHAFVVPTDVMTHRFVVGHSIGASGATTLRPWPLPRASVAAGGVVTSIRELLRYARFHLQGDSSVLADANRLTMQTEQAPAGNFADAVGLTWMLRTVGGARTVRHGGATLGQMAELALVPDRQFAIAVLTNANRGSELNLDVVKWALREYLGAYDPTPHYLELPADRLGAYVGRYDAPLQSIEVRLEDQELMLYVTPKGGFPTIDSPAPPPPPPARLAFSAIDRVVALDSPYRDARGEFLRGDAGTIDWMRFGGRAHRRLE